MKNNSKEMKLIRKKIDQIDDKLLPLMVKRSKLVEKALSSQLWVKNIYNTEIVIELWSLFVQCLPIQKFVLNVDSGRSNLWR